MVHFIEDGFRISVPSMVAPFRLSSLLLVDSGALRRMQERKISFLKCIAFDLPDLAKKKIFGR